MSNLLNSLARMFQEGGPFMYAIAGVSALALGVIIERTYYYVVRCRINAKALLTEVTRLVRSERTEDARKLCAKSKSPLSLILESGLWHFQQGESDQEIQNAVDEIALRELPKINKRTHYLNLFANVSTLLGLLGTIQGLIASFDALATAEASQKATLLAGGIAVAMNTTAMGLIVAIPCMIAFSILGSKANSIIEEIDESSVRVLNFLFAQRRA